QVGLTATPDARTYSYFKQNVVSEYTHQDAVRDGVNVSYDVYEIETEITTRGATIKKDGFKKEFRHKLTRGKEWQQVDNDITYVGRELDRSIVNKSQIRLVIETYRQKLFTELFPGRQHVPKTLIFAKDDSHANDIIEIVREVFDEGNDFCKKITYRTDDDPASLLNRFRNEYNPRIAVTVDMIATGTDVKALECLIFMRDVRSLNYYEQMKGRGTRTMSYDDLVARTPDVKREKENFVLIDAVGVEKSKKIISQPLERKKSVSLKDLVNGMVIGRTYDEDTMTTLAYRLSNMQHKMSPEQQEEFTELTGVDLTQLIKGIEQVNDPDLIDGSLPADTSNLSEEEVERRRAAFIQEQGDKAVQVLHNPEVRQFLFDLNKTLYQQIDNENLDTLLRAEWAGNAEENALKVITDFRDWIEQHKDEIIALQVFYSQPYRRRELTFAMVKQLVEKLKAAAPKLAPYNVYRAFQVLDNANGEHPKNDLVALVSVLRRLMEVDKTLTPYEQTVNRNFKEWIFARHAGAGRTQFTEEQMFWLRMIKDHVSTNIKMDRDDLDYSPFVDHG
ncbi:MAG: restriction endonuclease subunit R, partial [Sphingobacteriales bacterium]